MSAADPKGTVAWIIEPTLKTRTTSTTLPPPYLTLKQDVADKRRKAGDHVTPYVSKNDPEDEL